MSLISAGLKLIARTANDMLLNSSTQRAKKIAYQETGKAMRRANRKRVLHRRSKTLPRKP